MLDLFLPDNNFVCGRFEGTSTFNLLNGDVITMGGKACGRFKCGASISRNQNSIGKFSVRPKLFSSHIYKYFFLVINNTIKTYRLIKVGLEMRISIEIDPFAIGLRISLSKLNMSEKGREIRTANPINKISRDHSEKLKIVMAFFRKIVHHLIVVLRSKTPIMLIQYRYPLAQFSTKAGDGKLYYWFIKMISFATRFNCSPSFSTFLIFSECTRTTLTLDSKGKFVIFKVTPLSSRNFVLSVSSTLHR
jgi:hypothetical protein